ncbi:ribonuclease Z [Candidatus Methanoplasma termitum]|uniref:Ribonuclease Z n=1 Tax=Candidatus Methanoplasma termitum TaxID=1577791 RepID=A0A0A7LD92_9ARCH|nr:ribonuclease Z [Candidatus Methanoplasma termitum]AIZ56282.1 ribonuclease Z [Candidatus Methanoplasma termitum]MCL2333898.1 ribonuclease Z [Candidatus Methanoplasma sp.]
MLDILFLGTGASIPSRERGMPCVAVRCDSEVVLFDCGEGTQRQMMVSPMSFMRIKGIFITHMHGDHFLGLPGLLQTMGLSGRKDKLVVCGPEGLSAALKAIFSVCEGNIEYEIEVREIAPGERIEFNGFAVSAFRTDHSIPSFGYKLVENAFRGRFNKEKAIKLGLRPGPDFSKLQNGETVNGVTPEMVMGSSRPGCSIVYSGDTVPCMELSEAAAGADVLIHESTFSGKESKLAAEHKHSTCVQAAETAEECGCRILFLIHISNRYDDKWFIEKEAKAIFDNIVVPSDMDMYKVSMAEIRLV